MVLQIRSPHTSQDGFSARGFTRPKSWWCAEAGSSSVQRANHVCSFPILYSLTSSWGLESAMMGEFAGWKSANSTSQDAPHQLVTECPETHHGHSPRGPHVYMSVTDFCKCIMSISSFFYIFQNSVDSLKEEHCCLTYLSIPITEVGTQ